MTNAQGGLPLEPDATPPAPRWPGTVLVEPSIEVLLDTMATEIMLQAIECASTKGVFHLALGSAQSLQPLLERFMLDPGLRGMPWGNTHVWQADERCAVDGTAGVAWQRIHDTLVPHAGLARNQTHPMPAGDEQGPEHYARRLDRVLEGRQIDWVVTDAGPDGRIGGLPPGHAFGPDPVAFTSVDGQDVITLTPSAIARATVSVLVSDAPTRQCVDRAFAQEDSPVARLTRAGAQMQWCISGMALH